MTARVTLGPLVLHGSENSGPFRLEMDGEGVDLGAPESQLSIVSSLMADGSVVARDRDGNRTVTVPLWIRADNGLALAQAEKALADQVRRRNTLTWTPIPAFAPPTVFDVLDSDFTYTFDDIFEGHNWRQYDLSLTCHPFARSEQKVEVEAIEAPVPGGTVTATVEEHLLGKKILVFTYKPKRNERKRRGHRSRQTRVKIDSITA